MSTTAAAAVTEPASSPVRALVEPEPELEQAAARIKRAQGTPNHGAQVGGAAGSTVDLCVDLPMDVTRIARQERPRDPSQSRRGFGADGAAQT